MSARRGGPRLAAQILLYPCLAPARTTAFASYRQYADGPLMTRADMEWFWAHVAVTCRFAGLEQRALDAVVDEVEGGAAGPLAPVRSYVARAMSLSSPSSPHRISVVQDSVIGVAAHSAEPARNEYTRIM